ncbi:MULTISPECIES: hypothetical protein [unclassified Moraxella]|uniref:hypothetical protein n=1 Tax=unclassified Moraxella TaxID=2685852 RepID=UPI003AF6C1C6
MKDVPYRDGIRIPLLVATGVAIVTNQMIATNEQGFAVPAHDATAKLFFGRAEHDMDNSKGADGAGYITITRNRHFMLANDATAPLTQADIGKPVAYLADGVVGKATQGKLIAGTLMGLDSGGTHVWVEVGGVPTGVMA